MVQQSLGKPYAAVVNITASSMSTPKRDATNGVLTAELDLVSLTDQTGAAIGVAGNPLVVTTSGGAAGTPLGYQQQTATAALFTPTVPVGATIAIVAIEGNDARWRDDGTAPTTTIGMPIYVGQNQTFTGDLSTLEFIAQSGTTTYNVSYYS